MAIISVHRGRKPGVVSVSGGTQYIEGTLNITGAFTIELDPAFFSTAGEYVVIDYSAVGAVVTYPGAYASLQAALDALATVDTSDTTLTFVSLTDYPLEEKVKLVVS